MAASATYWPLVSWRMLAWRSYGWRMMSELGDVSGPNHSLQLRHGATSPNPLGEIIACVYIYTYMNILYIYVCIHMNISLDKFLTSYIHVVYMCICLYAWKGIRIRIYKRLGPGW